MSKILRSDVLGGGVTVDPRIAPGIAGDIGDLLAKRGSPLQTFRKDGLLDTDWLLLPDFRILASGTTALGIGATVILATVVRFPTERLTIFSFVTNNVAGVQFAHDRPPLIGPGSDGVRLFFSRTAVADTVNAIAANGTVARTVDWMVLAWRP